MGENTAGVQIALSLSNARAHYQDTVAYNGTEIGFSFCSGWFSTHRPPIKPLVVLLEHMSHAHDLVPGPTQLIRIQLNQISFKSSFFLNVRKLDNATMKHKFTGTCDGTHLQFQALGRLRQEEHCVPEASLAHTVRPYLRNKHTKKQKQKPNRTNKYQLSFLQHYHF